MKNIKQYLKQHLYSKLYENNENLENSIRSNREYLSSHPYIHDGVITSQNRIADSGEEHHHVLHTASLLATAAKDAFYDGHHDVARRLHGLSVGMLNDLPEDIKDKGRYVDRYDPDRLNPSNVDRYDPDRLKPSKEHFRG